MLANSSPHCTHGTFKGKVQQYHYASDNYTITYEDNDVERVTYANMKRVGHTVRKPTKTEPLQGIVVA